MLLVREPVDHAPIDQEPRLLELALDGVVVWLEGAVALEGLVLVSVVLRAITTLLWDVVGRHADLSEPLALQDGTLL